MTQVSIDPRVNVVYLQNLVSWQRDQALLYMQRNYEDSKTIAQLEEKIKELEAKENGN